MDSRILSYFCKMVGQKYQEGCMTIHVDELLSTLCVLIFPYVDDKKQKFLKLSILKKFVLDVTKNRNTRNNLNKLTKRALNGYFCKYLSVCSTEKKRELLSFTTIVTVEDTGYISFPKKPINYEKISKANVCLPTQHFGEIDNFETIVSKGVRKAHDKREPTELNKQERSEYECKLDSLMQGIRKIDGYRKDLSSLWRLNLGKREIYDTLKECLSGICGGQTQFKDDFLKRNSEAIAIYAALWFQWEFDGNNNNNDGNRNAFTAINMPNKAAQIIENIGLKDEFRYSAEKNDKSLFSLYVRGGFPLRNEKFIDICDTIFKWNEEEENNDIIEQILEDFGLSDKAFKQSLENEDGSLHQYVKFLFENGRLPIDEKQEDEVILNIISGWNKALKEGLEKNSKDKYRKFDLAWEAELYEGNLKLMLLLSMNKNPVNPTFSEDNDRQLIPVSIFKGHKIGKSFRVIVKNGDTELRRISFYGQGKKDSDGNYSYYTSYTGYEKFVLASDIVDGYDFGVLELKTQKAGPKDIVQKGKIDFASAIYIFVEAESETFMYDKIVIDTPIKFRFDRLFDWNTARTKGELALFLPRISAFKDTSMTFIPKQIANSGWLPITKPMEDWSYNGKKMNRVVPYIEGQLIVKTKEGCIVCPDVICYDDEKPVFYRNNSGDFEQSVLLLRDVGDIDVYLAKARKNRRNKYTVLELQNEYTAQYRQFDNDELKDIDADNIKPGYCEISIKLNNGNKSTICKCCVVDKDFQPQAATNEENCKDEGFENAYQFKKQRIGDGELSYFVYKGKGLYNRHTKRKLGNKGGVFRHFDCYYYRNSKGEIEKLYRDNKFKALRKVYNDIEQGTHNSSNQNIVLRISKENDEFLIQPFSNKRIKVTDSYEYRVPLKSGENGLEGCLFFYCTFDNILEVNKVEIELKRDYNNASYACLKFERSKSHNGLLFQSLKDSPDDDSTSEYYFRPIFVPKIGAEEEITEQEKKYNRKSNIEKEHCKLKNKNYKAAIDAFLLSTEHKLYYTSMDALCALVFNPDPEILIEFYLEYIQYCQDNKIGIDYNALYSLSDELLFDWWFIPKYIWQNYRKEHQKEIESLLLAKPCESNEEEKAKQMIVDMFWQNIEASSGGNDETQKVAKYICGTKRGRTNYFSSETWNNRELFDFSFVVLSKKLKFNSPQE